ncbi:MULTISPECIES: methyltransferase family protein [Echinimonadaceae]|uniref:Isoprenylcysteine carboxylmethyltransferase family protein n=2 Tax=Echinimonadaceae TaxID=3046600 RepID=A0A8J6UIG6_9GAMM|nr:MULTISPECIES: isoprenylcysteine carboxylmethyltransferase family protein [Echinimonadaceae]MBD1388413.1 isoprenylcysteine carboxylmethyltransferase family protein [Neiella litorisoli]MCM2679816.1 isoprenylcysteine carboxylmethyltransferase family protein [Echinimonas agarilytica]
MSYLSSLELKVPPIIVLLLTASLMLLSSEVTEPLSFDVPATQGLGWFFAIAGLIVIGRGVQVFRHHQTTVDPRVPDASSHLVVSDIYGYTRNPMYLGMALCLVGWAFYLCNLIALGLVFVFMAYITQFQVIPEERFLGRKFGQCYTDYAGKVGRWVGKKKS